MASSIRLTLPDGAVREVPTGTTAQAIAESISQGLAKKTLAARVNGNVVESTRPLEQDATLELLTWQDADGKNTFWHSSAHILAEALEHHYPGIKLGIGPPIENGFYYDVDFGDHSFTDADFAKVEQTFLELAKSGETFQRRQVPKAEAIAYFQQKGDPYKLELLEGLNDGEITFYESGNFVDLCRGPHLNTSKHIKAVKLLSLAGAYWRGNSDNKQLTRVYAISFPSKQELDDYLHLLEEAKRRDHRKLGKELDLFSFHEEGPGFPFWHHNGLLLFEGLKQYMRRRLDELDYQHIQTPIVLNEQLWHRSGHWQNYKDNMYFTHIDEVDYALKPMNCPGSTFVYKSQPRSYRDLPVRMSEFGLVHRYELSGVLMGLFRVRAFTQDDAHVFCLPSQIEAEIRTLIDLIFSVYRTFGFNDIQVFLSTRPEKYIGELDDWNQAEAALKEALEHAGVPYTLNEGDGAFYGPKIDFVVRDALRRQWQLGTIQLDFQMPQRFDLTYAGADNQDHRPVMIHRAVLGSFERFIGILLEHTAGELPLWIAPRQAIVLPISDRFNAYAKAVKDQLVAAGIRAHLDDRGDKIGKKIREAELGKFPYMLIVGEKEAEVGAVAVRRHREGDLGTQPVAEFIAQFQAEVAASYAPTLPEPTPQPAH